MTDPCLELNRAIMRYRRGGHTYTYADAHRLADAYMSDLDAREAEDRERALPIDVDWLLLMKFQKEPTAREYSHRMLVVRLTSHESGDVYVWVAGTKESVSLGVRQKRGEIIDLMDSMKIQTKGNDET